MSLNIFKPFFRTLGSFAQTLYFLFQISFTYFLLLCATNDREESDKNFNVQKV